MDNKTGARCHLDDKGIIQITFIGKLMNGAEYNVFEQGYTIVRNQNAANKKVLICIDISNASGNSRTPASHVKGSFAKLGNLKWNKIAYIGKRGFGVTVIKL